MALHHPHGLFREEGVPQADDRIVAPSHYGGKQVSATGEGSAETPSGPGLGPQAGMAVLEYHILPSNASAIIYF